ncbi:MAG: hypothetical protein ACRC06_07575, partial [Waterburya sp.]
MVNQILNSLEGRRQTVKSWQWRSLDLQNRTGSAIFAALFAEEAIATLLESPAQADPEHPKLSRYSICAGSPRLVEGKPQLWTPTQGEILPFLRFLGQQETVTETSQVNHLP